MGYSWVVLCGVQKNCSYSCFQMLFRLFTITLIETKIIGYFPGEDQAEECQRERDDQDDEEDHRHGQYLFQFFLRPKSSIESLFDW